MFDIENRTFLAIFQSKVKQCIYYISNSYIYQGIFGLFYLSFPLAQNLNRLSHGFFIVKGYFGLTDMFCYFISIFADCISQVYKCIYLFYYWFPHSFICTLVLFSLSYTSTFVFAQFIFILEFLLNVSSIVLISWNRSFLFSEIRSMLLGKRNLLIFCSLIFILKLVFYFILSIAFWIYALIIIGDSVDLCLTPLFILASPLS